MSIYYSKTTGGFYSGNLHANIPGDAVEVSDDNYQALIAAQSSGMLIVPDAHGNPTAVAALSLLSLDQVRTAQISALSAACQAEITGGYVSSALGAAHSYGSQDHDQRNLVDAVNASLVPGLAGNWTTKLWCAANGAWSFADHTAAQVQQAHSDWIAFRVGRQVKYAGLIQQVNTAVSTAAVQAVVWNS